MQQIIDNREGGLPVRNAINQNFTELYSAIGAAVPITILNQGTNFNQLFQAGNYVTQIYLRPVSGSITLNIGTTPNGGEILPDMAISYMMPIQPQYYFENQGYFYFTLTGSGTINITIYLIQIS